MLMVIFGAGASYDSIPAYPPGELVRGQHPSEDHSRPPLANQLFANRPSFATAMELFKECQPIAPRLQRLNNESLEQALQDLQEKSAHYARGRRQLAAVRFYIQVVIRDCTARWKNSALAGTNHQRLLNTIEASKSYASEPVCLVTFNYDLLLENALEDFGLTINTFDDYIHRHPFYRLFKLHGSVNWGHPVENIALPNPLDHVQAARQIIQNIDAARVTDVYQFLPPYGNGSPAAFAGETLLFPAIAIPVEKKMKFECPQTHLDQLIALLPNITKILIIGWSATEAHFLDLLRLHLRPSPRLHVIAGGAEAEKDAQTTISRIDESLRNNKPIGPTWETQGFTHFMHSRVAEKFLE